jgi:hypothetical protein
LPAALQTPSQAWPAADLAVAAVDFVVQPVEGGGTRVSSVVRNVGQRRVEHVFGSLVVETGTRQLTHEFLASLDPGDVLPVETIVPPGTRVAGAALCVIGWRQLEDAVHGDATQEDNCAGVELGQPGRP